MGAFTISLMTFLAHRCLEDSKLLMRKTASRFSDIISFHKRLILVFNIQNGWNEVIFQLIHLMGLCHYRLMDWLSSFAITQFSESIRQPLPIKSARQALNLSQLSQGSSIPQIKEIEQSCIWNSGNDIWIAVSPALVFLFFFLLLLNILWPRKSCPCKFSFLFSSNSLLSLNIFIKRTWGSNDIDTC